jgi:hypothetical protein
MHDYIEICHDGKAKWLSKSETDYDYNDLFWIWMVKSKTDYDCKNPVLDLDTIKTWMLLNPIQI